MPEIRTIDLMVEGRGHLLFCVFIIGKSKLMFPYDCVGQLGEEWIIRLSESPTWELATVSSYANSMNAGSVYLVRANDQKQAIDKIPMDDKLGSEWF